MSACDQLLLNATTIDALENQLKSQAIATDCNPCSSPTASLGFMMNMACHLFFFLDA